jgi:hypothetical protein
MTEYTVTWTIQVDAADHVGAAEQALAIQRDPESDAVVFVVEDYAARVRRDIKEIDLND